MGRFGLLLASGLLWAGAAAADSVGRLSWRGPRSASEARLVGNVGLVEGAELEPALLRRAIRVLILSGRWAQVRIEAERRGAVSDLIIELVPRERIVKVDFGGQLELSKRQAQEAIDIRPPEPYDSVRALSNAQAIRQRWRDLGYWKATVEPLTRVDPESREVELQFRIQAGPPTRLGRVDVLGAVPGLPETELRRRLESARSGQRYQRARLERDIDRLRRSAREQGYFDFRAAPPEITERLERNAVDLTLRFEVGPRYELVVEGVSMDEAELRERLPFWEEERVDAGSLEDAEQALVGWIQSRGHALAQAHADIETVSPLLKRIRIRVEPGPVVVLRSLQFRGNHHFGAAELRAELERLGSPLTEGGLLDPGALNTDREILRRRYIAAGFIDAKVTPEALYAAELDRANVIYRIEEGAQVLIEAVDLIGQQALSQAELRGVLQLQPGGPFDPDAVLRDANALHTLYAEAGYLDASIQPIRQLDRERARARIEFHINEGRQILVEALVVRGNHTTSEAVVRREVTLRAGDAMRASALLSSQRNLYRLDVFRSVILRPLYPGSLLARQPLLIDLEELPRYSMTYGFGYDTESGPRGSFGITDNNAFGRAQRLGMQLQASRRIQRAQLSLRDPKPWGRQFDTTAILFGELERFGRGANQVDVEIQRFGAALQLLREHSRTRTSLFEYKFQEVKNFFEAGATIDDIPLEDRAGVIATLSYRTVRDTRPNPFEPSRGSFLTANLELASAALGGGADFVKTFFQASKLLPMRYGLVLAAGARLGLAYGYRGEQELPFSERFFAGGANSLRGFGRDLAGPVSLSPDPNDPNNVKLIPLGGNALLVGNLELRVPLWGSIAGAVFTDIGNVFETVGQMRFDGLRLSLGVGLRYRTAVGPFRIDLGYNPDRRFDYEDATVLHVAFGHAF